MFQSPYSDKMLRSKRKVYLVDREPCEEGATVNEMIGNSLLRGVSQAGVKPEDKETKINFVIMPGGKAKDVVEVLKNRIENAKMKTRYALLLFQNDIKDLGRIWEEEGKKSMEKVVKELFEKITEIKNANTKDIDHKIAIAEEQYPPELTEYFGLIWLINEKIREENQANNVGVFKLWKSMMKSKPKSDANNPGSLPKVVNSRWREFQQNGSPGYHIGEGRNIVKFAQFIRRYFADPANWGELIQVTFENSD